MKSYPQIFIGYIVGHIREALEGPRHVSVYTLLDPTYLEQANSLLSVLEN